MSIKKQFQSYTKQGLVCFTGFMEEKLKKIQENQEILEKNEKKEENEN